MLKEYYKNMRIDGDIPVLGEMSMGKLGIGSIEMQHTAHLTARMPRKTLERSARRRSWEETMSITME